VLQTNIRFAQNLPVDHSLLLKLGSERRRSEFLSRVNFSDTYMSLAVLDSSRSIPFYVLGALFGVSGEEGEVIGRIFASIGLATLKVSSSDDIGGRRSPRLELMLHDIQHAFAEWLCVDSGSSVAKQHEMLLRSSAKLFARDGDVSDPSFDWSALCDHPDCGKGNETLATYVCDGLARHLLASCSDVAEDNSRCSRILGLLCSYKWIRGRGAAFDRRALLQDFATALKGLASVCPGGESETTKEERNKVSLFHGELLALEAITEVLQRVHAQRFVLDSRCGAHGAHDSGLAGQLYGRLSVVKFKGLNAAARCNAVHVVFTLLDNIRENVRPPWLLPRSECFGSVERKDARCFIGFAAGEGIINGLTYLRLGGADVLVPGDQDKVIRLHGICAGVRLLHVMSGHEHFVTAVGVADEYGTSAAGSAVIATSSMDGSVRLWRVDAAGSGNYECAHVLQGSAREMLHCVAITPDARRVVAGGIGNDDSNDSVSDPLPDRGEYRVHVWTRHGTTPGPDATVDAVEYMTLALDGHTGGVSGVQVSRDGERLVSGSSDGTVRVWHLPPSAAPAAADLGVGSSPVVDLRAAIPEYDDDKVNALSLTEESRIAFAGMLRGSIHVIDCNSGSVEASLRTERTGGSNVSCLTLIELNSNSTNSGGGVHGRLFAGHVNCVISEWDLKLRMCVAVYGDPRSGSGAIHSIAARLVPTAGGPGGENGGRSAAGGSAAGDGGNGRSGGLGSAESVIEFATGYYDGSARVWRVGDGKGDDGVEERDLSADLLSLKVSAAGCTSVPKRHIDIPGHTPSCISASADGRWVVSGSFKGMLCVWDLDNGRCVATLLGHEAAIVRAGIRDCGLIVVSCSLDSTVRIWNSKNRCWPLPIVLRHDRMATCAVLAADGSRNITGDLSGVVRVWDTMTGELCGPALRQHARAITTLAAECSLSKFGDRDRRGHDGNVTSETNWMANFKRLVGFGPQNPSTGLNFASCDAGGTCRLWRWPVENPVKSSSEIPFEQSLRKLFDGELDFSEPGCWQEQRYWWIDKPTKFRLSASAEARSAGCVVSYGVRNDRMMGACRLRGHVKGANAFFASSLIPKSSIRHFTRLNDAKEAC
jgi:WD40 repeat protein